MNTDTLENLTTEELEAALSRRRRAQVEAKEKAKLQYEENRDKMITEVLGLAANMESHLVEFKKKVHELMEEQAQALAEYGGIRGNSKGGFSVTNKEGNLRITRRRDTEPYWDERATKAIGLIKDFLHDTVKKRDMKLFEILISFLEKNSAGDLEYARVFALLEHENKFDDVRWKEGLSLLKESYSLAMKGFAYEFKVKDDMGKWQVLSLNFSGL